MKKMIMRITGMLMVLVMTLGLCITGFANEYSITVENSIGGKEYKAYKIFDALYNGEAVSYSIDEDSPWYEALSGSDSVFSFTAYTKTDGKTAYYVTLKAETADDAVIAALKTAFNSIGGELTADASGTGNGGSLKLDLNEAGYYYVTTSSGAGVSITTAAPKATVIDKAQDPGSDLKKSTDHEDYSIGDEVVYTVISYVPTYHSIYKVISYTFTDTMGEGLTYNAIKSIVITGSGPEEDITITLDPTQYTAVCENNILTISYDIADLSDYPADARITVTYTATVNDLADDLNMTNDVKLTWAAFDEDGNPDPGPDTTPEDKTESYTFGFDLKKTDEKGDVLTGAQFTLADAENNLISFVYQNEGGEDTYEISDGTDTNTTDTITVGDGNVSIWGLGEGTYTLTEIKAPDGYNLLNAPVKIVITPVEDQAGIMTGWTVAVNDTEPVSGTFSSTGIETDEHGIAVMPEIKVVNNAGAILPGTGGIGTTIFYIVGIILILAAAAFMITKWRLHKTR